ncbi:hypothetical protein DID88_001693 [Monilinia fructigena]|uniref:amidase n=1 Tax=Monilinia fructigena TaxID=38457 RepID=A0A395IWI6_9HELO|nr:hypothetical protein DID88_001693 [Monilinia fructigena]
MAPSIAEEPKEAPNTTPETKKSHRAQHHHHRSILNPHSPPSWQDIASRRRQQITSSIPPEWLLEPHHLTSKHPVDLVKTCGLLTEREIHMVYSTAVELLEKMKTREYTAVEVTRAFCKASAVAHQATNCLAWTMYPSALSRAAELDAHMAKTGEPVGPLHGLPISVKEHIYLLSTPSTSGFVGWADNFCTDEDQEGKQNRISTAEPPIPLNTSLSPGGSSGGESALIAMRGSVLGIGTDIGGSIRSPALSCGLYALKPSVARLPHSGLSGAHAGMESIIGVVGPLGRSLADVELFCKVLIDREPWKREVSLIPIPWRCRDPLAPAPAPASPTPNPANSKSESSTPTACTTLTPHNSRSPPHCPHPAYRKPHDHPFPASLHPALITVVTSLYLLDAGAEYRAHLALSSEPATPSSNGSSTARPHRRVPCRSSGRCMWSAIGCKMRMRG